MTAYKTDYKQLCAELLAALENEGYANWVKVPDEDELCLRARAALAEPEPEEPTDIEIVSILKAYAVIEPQMGISRILHEKHFSNAAHAILARLGNHPTSPDSKGAQIIAEPTPDTLKSNSIDKLAKAADEAFGED